jgi:hypothetical protein
MIWFILIKTYGQTALKGHLVATRFFVPALNEPQAKSRASSNRPIHVLYYQQELGTLVYNQNSCWGLPKEKESTI